MPSTQAFLKALKACKMLMGEDLGLRPMKSVSIKEGQECA